MKCFDGNKSDSKIFKSRCAQLVSSFQASEGPRYLVGDSKLYCQDNADNLSRLASITRIPRNYSAQEVAIREAIMANTWIAIDKENQYYTHRVTHLGIKQRWFVIYSESAHLRAQKTIERQIAKEYQCVERSLRRLQQKTFSCEKDAVCAFEALASTFKYHDIICAPVMARECYEGKGRPKKTDTPTKTVYQVTGYIASLIHARKERLMQQACYIIGTNTKDAELTPMKVIEAYKNQNASIERGFRFLKDPQFFVSSFFLKKPARIMALLMIMTLALLVYSVAQRHVRNQLAEQNKTLPNQINLPVNNPTMRWIFQMMEGIDVVYVRINDEVQRQIMGLTQITEKIIRLFGPPIRSIYQIENIKMAEGGCSM